MSAAQNSVVLIAHDLIDKAKAESLELPAKWQASRLTGARGSKRAWFH